MICTCKHPARMLMVEKDSTEKEDGDRHFVEVTHHLWCLGCHKPVTIKYSRLKTSTKEFLDSDD